MPYLPYILLLIGFPVIPIAINVIRHLPRYTQPGVGTQHILFGGMLIQGIFIGAGLGILLWRACN